MPIKPENKARYPKDWPAISLEARTRAGWRCQHEGCAAHQYAVGWWVERRCGHVWLPEWPRDGAYMGQTYSDARAVANSIHDAVAGDPRPTVIVLTVAHLDHQPENCDPSNLRVLCQRHHLAHDREHHRANAQATRRANGGTSELF